jgi:glycerol-3-phosphate dehydrogenase
MNREPAATKEEIEYLLEAVRFLFPALDVGPEMILSTFSGIRPIVSTGRLNPSRERRDHMIWHDENLISVAGGKLTTFRLTAYEVLQRALFTLGSHEHKGYKPGPLFTDSGIPEAPVREIGYLQTRRLAGIYGGKEAVDMVTGSGAGELEPLPGTRTLPAEVRWAARHEDVVHLDDLMLRRTRLGLLLEGGGAAHLDRIKPLCAEELGWSEAKWEAEAAAYLELWKRCYYQRSG